jgi:hypothetical protein
MRRNRSVSEVPERWLLLFALLCMVTSKSHLTATVTSHQAVDNHFLRLLWITGITRSCSLFVLVVPVQQPSARSASSEAQVKRIAVKSRQHKQGTFAA